jgi:hypothetical protein
MQINFKQFFDDEYLLSGSIIRLIELTQKNIDNNNNNNNQTMEKKNVKQLRNLVQKS